jgi:hypothetical protein
MSRSIARARAGRDRTSLCQEITDKIVTELEAGRVPWVQPWDQAILFTTCDVPGHCALEKAISRTRQIDHGLVSDFDGAIIFDEGDAVQHAAGEESERRAHDNLNAFPQAASVGEKAAG